MTATSTSTPYRIVAPDDLPKIIARAITDRSPISADVETTDLDPWSSRLITLQIGDGQTVYVADVRQIAHASSGELAGLAEAVRLLFSGRVELTGHNLKFDCLHLCVALGIQPGELRSLRAWDTMLAEQVILGGIETENGARERADLAATAARYGIVLTKEPRSWFADLDKRPEWHEPLPPEQLAYAARDVAALPAIRAEQEALIDARGLRQTIQLEMACLPAVAAMELAGIAIDREGWRSYIDRQRDQAQEIECDIQAQLWPAYRAKLAKEQMRATAALHAWEIARDTTVAESKTWWEVQPKDARPAWGELRARTLEGFRSGQPRPATPKALPDCLNLGSPVQLKAALALQGLYLVDTKAETLEAHQRDHPVLADLVRWRKHQKLVDTFGEAVLSRVRSDGRLHPSWRQIGSEESGVATGRMSCSEPNMQQLPARDEADGDSIRRHILTAPDSVLLSCDYSQIEPRVLAELSGDTALLDVFAGGADLYTGIAITMGLAPEGTMKEECKRLPLGDGSVRDAAKTLTLACMYGKGPRTLAEDLGCSEEEAKKHLDGFFATFPGVARYRIYQMNLALACDYSRTKGGRRRNFRLPLEPQRHQFLSWAGFMAARQEWNIAESRIKRQAVNHTIQGTAADCLKLALVLVFQRLPEGAQLVAAVHDELLIEAWQDVADEAAHVLATAMEQAARAYLPSVALGDFHVIQASYWRKE